MRGGSLCTGSAQQQWSAPNGSGGGGGGTQYGYSLWEFQVYTS
jgi:hypothetical protein